MPTLKDSLVDHDYHPGPSEGSSNPKMRFFAPLRMTSSAVFAPRYLFILLIRLYQNSLALIFPRSCRFYPSCSEYGILALKKYGFFKGSWLIIKRISKCHPFHPGGYDPA